MPDTEHCDHPVDAFTWNCDEASITDGVYTIPGRCSDCGLELEHVYHETGVRIADSNDYLV